MTRAIDQELQAEYGLAGARTALHQRRAATRQSAASYFIETRNAGGRLPRRSGSAQAISLHSPLPRMSRNHTPASPRVMCARVHVTACICVVLSLNLLIYN